MQARNAEARALETFARHREVGIIILITTPLGSSASTTQSNTDESSRSGVCYHRIAMCTNVIPIETCRSFKGCLVP